MNAQLNVPVVPNNVPGDAGYHCVVIEDDRTGDGTKSRLTNSGSGRETGNLAAANCMELLWHRPDLMIRQSRFMSVSTLLA